MWSAAEIAGVGPIDRQRVSVRGDRLFLGKDHFAIFLERILDVVVVDNLYIQSVAVGVCHFLVCAIGFDMDRRYTGLAVVHPVLQQIYIGLRGPLSAAGIVFPRAVKRTLRHRRDRHQ